MKITIENTDILTFIEGAVVRVWNGVTEGGIECDVYVKVIRVRADADNEAFERELMEIPEPAIDPDPAIEDRVDAILGEFIAYLNERNKAGVAFDPSEMRRRIARRIAMSQRSEGH